MIEQERIEYSQTRRRRQGENGDCADTTNISEQTQMDLALEVGRIFASKNTASTQVKNLRCVVVQERV